MLPVRLIISVLCAVGFYASVFMLRKSIADARGTLREPSVVQSPRARLFGGVPNALIGTLYYPVLAAVAWAAGGTAILAAAEAAALAAAAVSVYLAYSLTYATRKSCPYCWTAHLVNWALAATVPWLMALR